MTQMYVENDYTNHSYNLYTIWRTEVPSLSLSVSKSSAPPIDIHYLNHFYFLCTLLPQINLRLTYSPLSYSYITLQPVPRSNQFASYVASPANPRSVNTLQFWRPLLSCWEGKHLSNYYSLTIIRMTNFWANAVLPIHQFTLMWTLAPFSIHMYCTCHFVILSIELDGITCPVSFLCA